LAGISIVASETQGQKRFFEKLPRVGFTFPCGDIDALVEALAALVKDRRLLGQLSEQSQKQGRDRYNWSIEKRKLLKTIDKQAPSRAS
jgi:glycosyltransferase involved in cell wall biosynthesis